MLRYAHLLLDDLLDHLPAVGNVVHLLGSSGRNNDDTVLVSDDGITRADDDSSAADHAIALPWLHESGTLLGCGGEREGVQAVSNESVGVADGAVSDEASDLRTQYRVCTRASHIPCHAHTTLSDWNMPHRVEHGRMRMFLHLWVHARCKVDRRRRPDDEAAKQFSWMEFKNQSIRSKAS